MKLSERAIETAIVKRINLEPNSFCWKIPDQRQFVDGAYKKDPLMPCGQPDLTAIIHGNIVFLEVKTPAGELSKGQKIFHKKMQKCGITPHIVRSLADVNSLIDFYSRDVA